MKANLTKLSLVVFAAVSIVAARAFSIPQQFSTQSGSSAGQIAMGGPIAGNMNRAAMLASMLGLTAIQQSQGKAVFEEEEIFTKPLIEQLKQATDALESAEKTDASDAEIDQLATNMGDISGQLLAADAKAQAKIYGQLTEAQKEKLEQFPHPFFAPFAPLLPPGSVSISIPAH